MELRRGGLRLSNRVLATDVDATDDVTAGDDLAVGDDGTVTDKLNVGGTVTVGTTTADSSAAAAANDLVIKGSTSPGLSIIESGTSGTCSIYAGDSGSPDQGRLIYDHSGTPQWEIWTEDTEILNVRQTLIANFAATFIHYSADATYIMGTDPGSLGSPVFEMRKAAGGTNSINLRSDEAGTTRTRASIVLNASENLVFQHNDSSGNEDATVTVGADAVTIAAANVTLSDNSPNFVVGGGGGSPTIILDKSDAGSATVNLRSGFVSRGGFFLNSSENFVVQHQDSGGSADAYFTMSAALIESTVGVLLTTGGLRTGYRDLAANAALTLAATDGGGVITLHSTDTSTVAATMTALGAGSMIDILLVERTSTGKYTLACTYGTTVGTLTLDAQHEGGRFVYTGSVWRLLVIYGGAGFA